MWCSIGQDGSGDGVFGRGFCVDAGGDGQCDAVATTTTTTTTLPDCVRGDCNASDSLDAGDPICVVQCLVGQAPAGSDCSCAADCNCAGGTDAADPVCAVLRLIGSYADADCE